MHPEISASADSAFDWMKRDAGRWFVAAAVVVGFAAGGCGFGSSATSGAGGAGSPGGHGGSTNTGRAGTVGTGSGGASASGAGGAGGMTATGAAGSSAGGSGAGGTIPTGGTSGVFSCTPGVEELIITDCGYPYASSSPLTSTVFNENEVLRAIRPAGSWPNGVVQMFYNDEHAMTLGVRQVVVKSSSGTTTTDYPVTPLTVDPSSAIDPQTGTNQLVGDQSGLDASLRPMWPSLFITDISTDPSSRVGDWQQGGRPAAPGAIFGSWKTAIRTVDSTRTPTVTSITPDADPAKNNWNLPGADPMPTGLANEGYGAEARWNVSLAPGHSYRLQVLVHDGDQNKGGGDSGEACVLFCAGGGGCGSEGCGTTGTGGTGGGPECPTGYPACGPGGIAPSACPSGTVCANGCCLININ